MTVYKDIYGSTFFIVFPQSGEAREYCVTNKLNWFNSLYRNYSHAEQKLNEIVEQSGITGFCIAGLQLFNKKSKAGTEKQFKRLAREQKRMDEVIESLSNADNWTETQRIRAGIKCNKKVKEHTGTEGRET